MSYWTCWLSLFYFLDKFFFFFAFYESLCLYKIAQFLKKQNIYLLSDLCQRSHQCFDPRIFIELESGLLWIELKSLHKCCTVHWWKIINSPLYTKKSFCFVLFSQNQFAQLLISNNLLFVLLLPIVINYLLMKFLVD